LPCYKLSLSRGTPRAAQAWGHNQENDHDPQNRTVPTRGNERQDVRRPAFLLTRCDGERHRRGRLHRRPTGARYRWRLRRERRYARPDRTDIPEPRPLPQGRRRDLGRRRQDEHVRDRLRRIPKVRRCAHALLRGGEPDQHDRRHSPRRSRLHGRDRGGRCRQHMSRREKNEMPRLTNKIALITGAGTGIARATARAMAAEGAKIVVAELNAASGEQTAQIINQSGGDRIAITTDVTQEASVRAAIETAVRHYGGLHILHNNAGGSTPVDSTVVDVPIEEFWRAIRLDLFGTFLGCRFGIPAII